MRMSNLVAVDGEVEIGGLIAETLTEGGFNVDYQTSTQGLEQRLSTAQALVMDLRIPGGGVELIRSLRENVGLEGLGIVVLSGVTNEKAKLEAFGAGADDYVTKPFSPRELIARVKAVIRRSGKVGKAQSSEYRPQRLGHGALELHLESHKVFIGSELIYLTFTEFKILAELLRNKGVVLSREHLRATALNDTNVTDRTIDVHLTAVRKKLGQMGSEVHTVRGRGYRFG